jgi:pantoate--beta-alanine ligase
MQVVSSIVDLEQILTHQHTKMALVPTMGALHEGHLSLVEIAKSKADFVMVSIFVNPLQFGPNEDFTKYPRDLRSDLGKLAGLGVDLVFAPEVADIYQSKPKEIMANPQLANILCGLSRPGHFDGVCTVVYRLFELMNPSFAIFGEKDYQQLMIIQDMVKSYKLAVEIVPAPIIRESSGLALSSRNQYLSDSQKLAAANIHQVLKRFANDEIDINFARDFLSKLGIELEYLEKHFARTFIAAKVGSTRLIDNV